MKPPSKNFKFTPPFLSNRLILQQHRFCLRIVLTPRFRFHFSHSVSGDDCGASASIWSRLSWPQAAWISVPISLRIVAEICCRVKISKKRCIRSADGLNSARSVTGFMGIRFTFASWPCRRWPQMTRWGSLWGGGDDAGKRHREKLL